MSSLERFQLWYSSQCDGDWEHDTRIAFSSIDNPGWRLRVNVEGTSVEGRIFSRLEIERSSVDWLQVWKTGEEFNAACGPTNLGEVLSLFCDWTQKEENGAKDQPEQKTQR